jgi:ribosome-binding factor A
MTDPRLGFVTVVKVEVSPDLKVAKVHVSVLGEQADVQRTLLRLQGAAPFIRHEVAEAVELRIVPQLLFVEDKSVKGSVRVSRLIAEALAGSKPPAEGEPGEDPDKDEEDADIDEDEEPEEADGDVQEDEPEEGREETPEEPK